MQQEVLLLGVDGGGTRCRARLTDMSGAVLGEGMAGPANVRFGLGESFAAVREAFGQCLQQAGEFYSGRKVIACLALAGASEAADLPGARAYANPFHHTIITTDARAACVGAHAGGDGGIIIIGTGSVGWAMQERREYRVGGWGFPVSDEGSGAWLGCEAVRRVLWAHDGRIPWTDMLQAFFDRFDSQSKLVVRWMIAARPRDFATLAPTIVEYAVTGDPAARELMQLAAGHIDATAARLRSLGVSRLCLMGGLAGAIEPFLSDQTKGLLVPTLGDALSGALHLARVEAQSLAAIE